MQKEDAKMNDCPSWIDNHMGKYAVCKMVYRRFAIAEMLCKNKKTLSTQLWGCVGSVFYEK